MDGSLFSTICCASMAAALLAFSEGGNGVGEVGAATFAGESCDEH